MKQGTTLSRRTFITAGSVSLLSALSLPAMAGATVSVTERDTDLRFLINRKTSYVLSDNQRAQLEVAVIDFLKTHYSGMSLQFWGLPFEQIDFKKRLTNIIYWVNKAVEHHESTYPVDPIWVLSQIKAESLFCEFALSSALAAGICQFMPYTAREGHQMLVAGDLPEHHMAPYKKPELANSLAKYNALIKERSQFRKDNRQATFFDLQKALDFLKKGKSAAKEAKEQLDYLAALSEIDDKISQAKADYLDYMEVNITDLGKRDLFGHTEFFSGFDERLTYRKPIFAMVKMLANALRVRNGNILSAAAAYNAGLSRTWTQQPIYTNYGLIPAFEETSRYISKVVANYEEISRRYHAA